MEDKNRDRKKTRVTNKTLTNTVDVNPTVLIKTLRHQKNASKMLLLCLNYYL